MEKIIFSPNEPEIVSVLSNGIIEACEKLNFDIQCLDWFSYTPDFFIEIKNTNSI